MSKPKISIHDFPKDLTIGKIGEDVAKRFLEKFTDCVEIIDVSDDRYWQRRDVDMLFYTTDGYKIKVEVKTDRYTLDRMCYELESDISVTPHIPGWTVITECDWLLYYFINEKRLYIMNVNNPSLK